MKIPKFAASEDVPKNRPEWVNAVVLEYDEINQEYEEMDGEDYNTFDEAKERAKELNKDTPLVEVNTPKI